jgi:hypothetical protein
MGSKHKSKKKKMLKFLPRNQLYTLSKFEIVLYKINFGLENFNSTTLNEW